MLATANSITTLESCMALLRDTTYNLSVTRTRAPQHRARAPQHRARAPQQRARAPQQRARAPQHRAIISAMVHVVMRITAIGYVPGDGGAGVYAHLSPPDWFP
eukprot:7548018-Pyramimonas_sp.AAC.1